MINAGTVYGGLVLNADQYFKTLEEADKKTKSFENKLKGYGDKIEKAGKTWSKKVSAPIVGVGALATKLGIDFQSAMSEVGAISGATAEELEVLEKKAREMGATTKFSASDAADGLKYMAQAGWETDQMLEGIEGVMMLAAASGEDLAVTSGIVTSSLAAFGMEAAQAGEFADLLASASSSAQTDVALMGETLKYAAPIFGAAGYSAEDAALAIGLMANQSIVGSQAGTVLRAAVTRLVAPSDEAAEKMKELGIEITDAEGNMLPFKDVMDDLRGVFGDLTKEQQLQTAELLFGKEAMSGMLAIVNSTEEDYEKLTKATSDYTGTAKDMSDFMQDNLKGRWEEFKSGVAEVALQIYDLLLPALESWLAKGQAFVDWFSELDDGTKKTILNIAGLAAAIGPLLIAGGKVAAGVGSIIGLAGKLSGATTVATAATAGLTTPVWALGGAAKASALLLNPWTAAIVAGGVAAYGLHRNLSQDAIPSVELFGDEVSDATQKAVGGFLELEEDATISLNQLMWSGQEVTEEMKDSLVNTFDNMKDQIVGKLNEQKSEALESLGDLFSKSTTMTDEEKEEMLRITTEKYDVQINKTKLGNEQISKILETAKNENRAITEEEKNIINKIKEDMKKDAVRVLSESEKEQLAIMERLRQESGKISAKQAAEIVKNSKEQKEKTIKEAEEEYNERLKYAATLRADGSKESEELANKIIEEAERQKNGTIKNAKEMHEEVIKEAREQAREHVNKVDWTTGEVLSKWEVMKRDSIQKAKETGEGMKEKFDEIARNSIEWGQNVADGISKGIEAGREWVNDKMSKLAEGMAGTFKNFFGIASPSKLMAEYGKDIDQGLADGIYANKDIPLFAMRLVNNELVSAANKTLSEVDRILSNVGKKTTSRSSGGGGSSGYKSSSREREEYQRENREYERENSSEIDRISREHDVDTGVAREMARTNEREGKKIYHDGGWVGRPLFDLEGMLAKIQGILKYDELAGILQDGEFVLSRDMVDRLQGAMASIDMVTTPRPTLSKPTAAPTSTKGGDIHQQIIINSPTPLTPSEVARKNLQVSRQLAMEWGI